MNYQTLKNENEIFELFLKENPVHKGNIKKPHLILLDGITGTGKSTIARIIAEKENIVVLNNDKVRQFLAKTGINKDWNLKQKLVKKIQYYRIKETLKNGNNCLLDGNISNDFEAKISVIKDLGYKYYIIKLVYDREKVIERIKNRKIDKKALNTINGSETINYSDTGIEDFLRMEKEKCDIPEEYIYFKIDTSKELIDLDNQVNELIKKIKDEL